MRYGNDNHNNKKEASQAHKQAGKTLPSIIKREPLKFNCCCGKYGKGFFNLTVQGDGKKVVKKRRSQAFTCSCYSIMKLKFNSLMFYVYIYLCIICYMLTWKHHISFMQIKSTSKRSLEHAKRIICYFYALCIVHGKPGKASILNYIMGIEKSN